MILETGRCTAEEVMSSTPAMAARHLHAPLRDPYRVLFDHLPAGAARCRVIVEQDRVVGIEVVDSNAACEPLCGSLPHVFELLSRARLADRPEHLELRVDGALLSVSAYPVDGDEV